MYCHGHSSDVRTGKGRVLLKRLDPDVVTKVLRFLDPRHAGLVQTQMAKLDSQGDLSQKMAGIVDEAVQILEHDTRPPSAPAVAAKVDGKNQPAKAAVVPERGHGVDIRVGGAPEPQPAAPPAPAPLPIDASADPLRVLAELPAELLASALNTENARTTSLLMNCLDIEVASQIYKRLSPTKRREVSLRFTDQVPVGEDLLKRIAQGVLKKCQTLREASPTGAPTEEGAREKRIAALLRGLDRTDCAELVAALEEADAELTGRVKALLYQFEDILRMENTSVQKLLSEVDVKSLAQRCAVRLRRSRKRSWPTFRNVPRSPSRKKSV